MKSLFLHQQQTAYQIPNHPDVPRYGGLRIQRHRSLSGLLFYTFQLFMLRFVIQEHYKRKTRHFDLMFESSASRSSVCQDEKSAGGSCVLKTWSFAEALREYGSHPMMQKTKILPNHRLKYLDYEGEISRGRGWVKIWDKGYYQKIIENKNCHVFLVKGQKIKGYLIILFSLPLLPPRLIPLIRFQ